MPHYRRSMPDTIAWSVKVAQDDATCRDIRDGSWTYPFYLSIGLLRFAEEQKLTGITFAIASRSDLKISTDKVSTGKIDGEDRPRSQSREIIYDDRVTRLVPYNVKRWEEESRSRIRRDVFVKYIPPCVFFVFSLPLFLAVPLIVSSSSATKFCFRSFSFTGCARCTLSIVISA